MRGALRVDVDRDMAGGVTVAYCCICRCLGGDWGAEAVLWCAWLRPPVRGGSCDGL